METLARNAANKEKQIDSHIGTTMVDDSYEHMKPKRGDMANEFVELDPYFDSLTLPHDHDSAT